ncbi:MAG: hypothetical protein ACLU61_05590 [Lachnospiraceae bacterium]
MRRVMGFACFWLACGMMIMLFMENIFIAVLIIIILLLVGYNLFCC